MKKINLDRELHNIKKIFIGSFKGVDSDLLSGVVEDIWVESLELSQGYLDGTLPIVDIDGFKRLLADNKNLVTSAGAKNLLLNFVSENSTVKHHWDLDKVLNRFQMMIKKRIKNHKNLLVPVSESELTELLNKNEVEDSGGPAVQSFSTRIKYAEDSVESYGETYVEIIAQAVFAHAVFCQSKNLQIEILNELNDICKTDESFETALNNLEQIKNEKVRSWMSPKINKSPKQKY